MGELSSWFLRGGADDLMLSCALCCAVSVLLMMMTVVCK